MAGLGFLHNIGLEAANEKFKGVKVDALKDLLVDKYMMMCPSVCNRCETIYKNYDNDIGAPCFLCEKRLCPDCCPEVNSNEGWNVVIFPICNTCSNPACRKTTMNNNENIPITISDDKKEEAKERNDGERVNERLNKFS